MLTPKDRMVLEHLSQFVSDHKKDFIQKVLNNRTRHITIILEDIYQSQNASAVVRTCECMGIQDIHIVEQQAKYEINPRVLKGANKWMTLFRYHDKNVNNTKNCFDKLRNEGYLIVAADPAEDGVSIDELNVFENKVALIFGNELRGVSSYGLQNADRRVKIPMYGFTESLNISVSAAICLNILTTKLHQRTHSLYLSEEEQDLLKLAWFKKIVRRSDLIEQEFLRTIE